MREWNLSINDPLSLTLAADSRLTTPDYHDDQIWELSLSSGDPPAIRLYTNFGLRCRSFHIYPRFIEDENICVDPSTFTRAPVIRQIFPNLISLGLSPFPEIDVEISYWVPNSKSISCKSKIINRSNFPRRIMLEWAAILIPADDGEPMSPIEIQAARVLVGRTSDLVPIILLSGGTETVIGSHQTLSQIFDIDPHNSQELILSHAARITPEESFNAARQIVARSWEAERAKIEMHNSDQFEIFTGDPDWDITFALSQKLAYSLLMGPTDHLPALSFVLSRRTDQGYSLTGDGQDYGQMWNGQTAFDTYTLVNHILPASPDLAKGLMRNLISTQTENGMIDWKPGLSGQRSNTLTIPLLATLTWRIYLYCEDDTFLKEMFPPLLSYIYAWFSEDHDRDRDSIPEWDHPLQAGIEDHPLFSRWHDWSQGLDISSVENPLLCSYIYHECKCLIKIAESLSRSESIPEIEALADGIRTAIDSFWNAGQAIYHYWDRDTHSVAKNEFLTESTGPGIPTLPISFDQPVRINFRIKSELEITRRLNIFIHGTSKSGKHRVERISPDQILWFLGTGYATSVLTYVHIEHIEIQGLDNKDIITIYSVNLDFSDITLLMPLWAKIPSNSRAEVLIKRTITDPQQYWREYGLPTFPDLVQEKYGQLVNQVSIPWNILIGEGLIKCGFRSEAAILTTKIMKAIIMNLKTEKAFFQYYDSNTGKGFGDKDSLNGLAPLKLFLDTLGVRIYSQKKVALEGFNPFPWTVTIKFKGLTIVRQAEDTQITFPNHETVVINDPEPRIIFLDPGSNQIRND
jgi:hypothetical protein